MKQEDYGNVFLRQKNVIRDIHMIRLSEISSQCKSLQFKQMHVVCCLVPIYLLCFFLFIWGRCYPACVQQPVLNLSPGSQLGGDLLKICEKDEMKRIRCSKQHKIHGQKYEYVVYCNCKLVFFLQCMWGRGNDFERNEERHLSEEIHQSHHLLLSSDAWMRICLLHVVPCPAILMHCEYSVFTNTDNSCTETNLPQYCS